MCKSQAEGGQRCSAHSNIGIAATTHASVETNLDDAQIASVFQRLRRTHKDVEAPDAGEAIAVLSRLKRDAEGDPSLPKEIRQGLADRYDKAIADVETGTVPDGRTLKATEQLVVEAQIAQRNLDLTLRAAARAQRTSPDRLAAKFRKWRRDPDSFEDIEAPDPAFRLPADKFPGDKRTQAALRKLGFENYLAQRLAVFTYGTLRNGQGNDRLMDGAIASRSEEAQIEGIAVYGPSWGFPYAMEAPDGDGLTKGDLVFLSDDPDGDWARDRLDSLEGFDSDRFSDSHYRRVERMVTYRDPDTGESRQVKAWVYLAGKWSQDRCTPENRIAHGDWVQGKREYATATGRNRSSMWWDDIDDTSTVDHGYADDPDEDDGTATYSGDYVVTKPAVG